jgi:hypothetical protein
MCSASMRHMTLSYLVGCMAAQVYRGMDITNKAAVLRNLTSDLTLSSDVYICLHYSVVLLWQDKWMQTECNRLSMVEVVVLLIELDQGQGDWIGHTHISYLGVCLSVTIAISPLPLHSSVRNIHVVVISKHTISMESCAAS